jgi:hypothetical protein
MQGRTLLDFQLPTSNRNINLDHFEINRTNLINEELGMNTPADVAEFNQKLARLTNDQRQIYNNIMRSVNQYPNNRDNLFFLNAPGGTGKTFLLNTILAGIRTTGNIALAVASSGIASLLLKNGRTAHSRFKIPIQMTETSTCNISQQSELA